MTVFDSTNKEQLATLKAILTEKGLYPSAPMLCTKIKEDLVGKEFLPESIEALIASYKAALAAPARTGLLSRLHQGKRARGWTICLYGAPKTGKSTLASLAPKPLFADVEGGLFSIGCDSIPIATWPEFLQLLKEFGASDYLTLVVDTADVLEKRLWAFVCAQGKYKSIESPGYGKGYAEAYEEWVKVLDTCKELNGKGKNVIFTAHSSVKTILSPDSETYDRHQINLHSKVSEYFYGQMDLIGFCHHETFIKKNASGSNVGLTTTKRMLLVSDSLAAQCGNRFSLEGKLEMNQDLYPLLKA
jgi:hypothetical protein